MRSRAFDRADLRDDSLMPADLTAQQRRAAALTVAEHATGADDLRDLLDALGLLREAS